MEKMDIECSPSQEEQIEILAYGNFSHDSDSAISEEDKAFNDAIESLQEIVICPQFEKKIQLFMKNNWERFGGDSSSEGQVFQQYSTTFSEFLNQKIKSSMPGFKMSDFFQQLEDRRNQVDEQILDTLDSLRDLNCFRSFIRDYKTSHDEVQTYKVLTIKTNKIPENKQVKGKDNIFGTNAASSNPLFESKMKKAPQTKTFQNLVNKTEDELLVPEIVLTVKGMRKS